jgi:hypothetical protein
MRSLQSLPFAAGVALLAVTTCHADVIIKLRSGLELRATRTWTDGNTIKAQVGSGVIGLPSDSIASMTKAEAAAPPAMIEREAASAVGGASSASPSPAKATTGAPASAASGATASDASHASAPAPAAGATVEEHVPDVPGEDSLAKMERLDALLLKTHREFSIARTQGQPQETLDALQRRIDDINAQRETTMRRLKRLR